MDSLTTPVFPTVAVTTASSQTRHIAPSLRLFVPNDLTEYNNPFLLDLSVVQYSR
jgi:hypothetical protein